MGRRKQHQEQMFSTPARGGGHRFYAALNKILDKARFDEKVEALCAPYYEEDDKPGRPSVAPGIFFRMLLVGYFEGIGSERGIAWRCADSMSLRDFLNLATHVPVPDQSTVSRTRRRLPPDVFDSVFQTVLGLVEEHGLFKGRVRGVDSTYLKADASMRSIVRTDTGEGYRDYIKRVTAEDEAAEKSGGSDSDDDSSGGGSSPVTVDDKSTEGAVSASEPNASPRMVTAEEAVRHDRTRKKSTSNKDWLSPMDSDARITRMKNGTTRLAYKAEHVVDMESGVILAAEIFKGTEHDAATIASSLAAAEKNIAASREGNLATDEFVGELWHKQPTAEVVADKGYHKASTLLALKERGYRTFIPERKQHGQRTFADKGGKPAAQAFHANRARTSRRKGKDHQRRRGEMLERPNQHLYDRGDLRELTVTGQVNVKKRVLIQAAAFNLGAVMRKLLGAGAPKWLVARMGVLAAIWTALKELIARRWKGARRHQNRSCSAARWLWRCAFDEIGLSTSAC